MINFRYALASVAYHKRMALSIGLASAVFLFLATSMLNIIDLERAIYQQLNQWISASDYFANYHKTMQFYYSLYFALMLLGSLLLIASILLFIKAKEQDLMKWRLTGLSNTFIIKQSIIESLIPVIVGLFFTVIFLVVCQHTYEYLLMTGRPWLSSWIDLKPLTIFSAQETATAGATNLSILNSNIHFFSLKISNLSGSVIFKALSLNGCYYIGLTSVSTILFTYYFTKKGKKSFRM
ncbi:hypothetical protein GIX45_10205 [Erwinia sp. CPCC 100877]|nr:hypothetical protein [Erwinia sp. CPCC 100877]